MLIRVISSLLLLALLSGCTDYIIVDEGSKPRRKNHTVKQYSYIYYDADDYSYHHPRYRGYDRGRHYNNQTVSQQQINQQQINQNVNANQYHYYNNDGGRRNDHRGDRHNDRRDDRRNHHADRRNDRRDHPKRDDDSLSTNNLRPAPRFSEQQYREDHAREQARNRDRQAQIQSDRAMAERLQAQEYAKADREAQIRSDRALAERLQAEELSRAGR